MKSQLAAMSGVTPATIAPQSAVARFVYGDIKGGEQAHEYRMSVIAAAILESFKGNFRNMLEAAKLTNGKSKKARAYHAGFAAVGTIAPLSYAGKWADASNAAIRTEAATLSQAAEFAFESAFLTVLQEKAAPKAVKPAAQQPAPAAEQDAPAEAPVPATPAHVELDVADMVDTVVSAIAQGMLSSEELVMIRAALAVLDGMESADSPVMVAVNARIAANPLLQPQAH